MNSGLRAPLAGQFEAMPGAWRALAESFLCSAQADALCRFVDGRLQAGAVVFPPQPLAALQQLEPADVRVVIVGQDPYHGAGQAHGLAFSVPAGVRAPPSLRNILGEVARDGGCEGGGPPCLRRWARQGVLLINAVLTVEQDRPGSHARQGWEEFTSGLIGGLAREPSPKVFMLWGAFAQLLRPLIEAQAGTHRILMANHPSPLSARRGPLPFIGCAHFSSANEFLRAHARGAIDWCAP